MEAQPKTYHFYSWFFPGLFTTRRDEKLFLEYTTSQKQRAIPRLLVTGLLLQLYSLIVPGRLEYSIAYSLTAVATFSNLMLLTFHYTSPTRRTLNSHLSWLVIWLQLLINASLRAGDAYNELLGWAALIQYLTLATLPFSAPILILYSLLSMTAYLLVQYLNATMMGYFPEDFMEQEICNGSILVCASLLGATGFVMYENQHRRSFVETKRSLRDKLTIDQQSKEQERLLLSVLPEHVAVQMRKDLGLIDTQFKKIYMSRHENVSILYADIVGFTAISSTYSAQDLVAILNELFARFDRLSEKYQQLRIKILGDCYYCISGAPVERPDHAVLCVHMGLSMVKAIKYVQQTTNSPVDMRVGIHTGAVLAGVLGQRQWQFDVYSRDVELANKMESSGMAGRVHVSEVTLGFLKDEFEVEPAYGEKREEMLRQAGIKTYFIVKVLKPYHGDEKSGEGADEDRGDTLSDLRDEDEDSVLSAEGEKQASEDMLIYNMLEEELRNRDDSTDLLATGWCLRLRYGAERVYQCRGDTNQALLLLPPVFLLIPIAAVALLAVETRSVLLTYVAYVIVAPLATFVYYVCYMWRRSKGIQQHPEVRSMYSLVHLTMFIATGIIQLMYCGSLETQIKLHELLNQDIQPDEALRCAHPSYYYHNLEVLSIEDLEHIQPEKITQHQEAPNFCTDLEPLPSPPRFVEDTILLKLLKDNFEATSLLKSVGKALENDSARNLLASIICKQILKENKNSPITSVIYNKWSKEIKSIFPNESIVTYYIPPCVTAQGVTHQARGKLVSQLLNIRRKYQKLGVLEVKENKKQQISDTVILSPRPLPISVNALHNTSSVQEDLAWLKKSSEPWALVESKWNGTLQKRSNDLRQPNYTIEEYFEDYPAIKKPKGYKLMACCCLCCGILITPASCIRRIVIIISLSSYYVIPSVWMPIVLEPRPTLDLDPYLDMQNGTIPYMLDRIFYMRCWHEHRHLLMIYLVAFTVCIFDRYLEAMERARFLRGERMRQQAEQAGDLRRRNQALVYNVLPPHVARHFMGAHRNHRDLYSQSYAEVGVLFASMPNFTEFYSEETVNNQGLECLRFLNEVISDFDTLLEDARFRDIIKIKTISSTYMAASGLNPERDVKNADTTTQRWKHLMCLVEFALELQRVLAAINEQSFNHFVLRMGVNHGPITAGVIGAKKPHYDIWGNTVNVASRMESTGKAGCIQVTEETCEILKDFGYYFEQRGLVAVKGKGQLMTYYLQGRNNNSSQEKPKAEVVEHSRKCPLMLENGSANALVSQANADQDDTVANIPLLPKKM